MRDYLRKVEEVQDILRTEGLVYKIDDVCKLAASMHAPQFYTDTRTALKQYNLYLAGKSSIRNEVKRQMYAEIFARYENLVNTLHHTGQCVRKNAVMTKVLNQEAPSFYYDEGSALKMYYYAMTRKRKKLL